MVIAKETGKISATVSDHQVGFVVFGACIPFQMVVRGDGLYWAVEPGEKASPLGPLVANARSEGYKKGEGGKPVPQHGHYYRILKVQGPDAPGGAYNYVVNGQMFGGFALAAYPASWGNSGVMTFIVNHDGVVYQKDLGPNTAAVARAMTQFNPDNTWKPL